MILKKFCGRAMLASAAIALMSGGAVIAQEATVPAAKAAPAIEIAPVNDAEASQFVAANLKVNERFMQMQLDLSEAASQEEADTIQGEAKEDIVAAIEEEGLTQMRYAEIAHLAQNDPQTLSKLKAELDEENS
tara:strand:- start:93 stop:491 length:399 start_codon:yes stop_codon:yes gene_type:complete